MIRFLCISALLALAACGADGAPERPAAKSGVTFSGEISLGIAKDGN